MRKTIIICILLVFLATSVNASNRPATGALVVDSLKYEPYPAESGSYMDIWIKVENYGNKPVEDASFILEPKFPFSLDSNEKAGRELGTLDVDEEVVLEYKIRISEDAVEGINELDLKFTSGEGAWITHTFDILVRTHDTMLNTQKVEVEPEEVAPGEVATVSLMLKNMADSTIKDLRAELELIQREVLSTSVEYKEFPFTPIDSTNVLMAQRLGPKQQKIFTFNLRVDPDTEPKVYRVPLTLTYSDEIGNTTYTEEGIIAIVVSKKPDIMVNLDDTSIYTPENQGEVTVGIYNTGMSRIKFAVLEIVDSENYEILSTPKIYLGNVDSDDYETANFDIYVREENPELKFILDYKDEYNEEHRDELNIKMKTYSDGDARKYGFTQGSSAWTIIIILLIVAGGVWFYIRRKKKKRKH